MPDNAQENEPNTPKSKRPYVRKAALPTPTALIAPNPNVIALESDYVALVRQRSAIAAKLNQATMQFEFARNELNQIENEIQFLANSIAQMKNGGLPVPQQPYVAHSLQPFQGASSGMYPSPPYNPVQPYPAMPPNAPVGSYPAPNQGLYPDATDRLESAEDVRQFEASQRGR